MGPFLGAILASVASFAAAGAAAEGGEGPAEERLLAAFMAAALVVLALLHGRGAARRRAAVGIPAAAIGGGERAIDLLGYLLLVGATRWPELATGLVPLAGVGPLAVFAPYLAAAAARVYGAEAIGLAVVPAGARPGWPPARAAAFHARLVLIPVAPMYLLDAARGAAESDPRVVAAFAAYPGLDVATSCVGLGLVTFAAPFLLRVLVGARRLDDPELRADCDDLLRRVDFPVPYLGRVATGGRVVNAVYLGTARPARTVLFSDGLLARLGRRERLAVFAHEVGHGKLRHLQYLTLFLGALLVATYAFEGDVAAAGGLLGGAAARAFGAPALAAACSEIFATAIGFYALLFALVFAFGFVSRRFETEADLFAADALGDPEVFASALATVGALAGPGALRDGFRHFGVPRRIEIVRGAANADVRRTWDAVFRRLRVGVVACAVVVIGRVAVRLPGDLEAGELRYRAALAELAADDGRDAASREALASLRVALEDPRRRFAAAARGTAVLMDLFDDAMRRGDYARARAVRDAWATAWPKGDAIGDFNRLHAEAQLAALDEDGDAARRAAEANLAALADLETLVARRVVRVEPTSKERTTREIRYLAALAGAGPAAFEPDASASARAWAAIVLGPEGVPVAEARRALAELAADDAWARAALETATRRRGAPSPAEALRAKYGAAWESAGP